MVSNLRGVRLSWLLVITTMLALVVAGCGQKEEDDFFVGTVTLPDANEVVGEVAVGSASGTYVAEDMPTGTGPGPELLGSSQYIQGASIVMMVTTSDTATQLLVGVRNTETGYYRLDLVGTAKSGSSDLTLGGGAGDGAKLGVRKMTSDEARGARTAASVDYIVTLSPASDPAYSSFTVDVLTYDGAAYSEVTSHQVRPNTVAGRSNYLQVSLNWAHEVDYDLHVETPTGTDIYWANKTADGGTLDLDSNAGCSIDNVNNENITWLNQVPASGSYIVRVNLWSSCQEPGPFPYVLTVVLGGEPATFWGEMTIEDAYAGGAHSGAVINEFSLSPAQIAHLLDR